MRIITSLFLISLTFSVPAQRISFEDPDLTFSFKKPKDWQVFDDGYIVKVSPSPADSSAIYLTITYFSAPKPMEGYGSTEFPESLESVNPISTRGVDNTNGPTEKIMGQEVQSRKSIYDKENDALEVRVYAFYEADQQWEVLTSMPESKQGEYQKAFRKIMRTLRID